MASDHSYEDDQSLFPSAAGSARVSSASTTVASPISPVAARHRPGYARLASVSGVDDDFADQHVDHQKLTETTKDAPARSGLGITGQPFVRAGNDEQTNSYTPLAGSAGTSFSTRIGSPGTSFGEDFTNDVTNSSRNMGTHSNKSTGSLRSGAYIASRDTENLLRKSVASTRTYMGR